MRFYLGGISRPIKIILFFGSERFWTRPHTKNRDDREITPRIKLWSLGFGGLFTKERSAHTTVLLAFGHNIYSWGNNGYKKVGIPICMCTSVGWPSRFRGKDINNLRIQLLVFCVCSPREKYRLSRQNSHKIALNFWWVVILVGSIFSWGSVWAGLGGLSLVFGIFSLNFPKHPMVGAHQWHVEAGWVLRVRRELDNRLYSLDVRQK